MGGNVLAIHKSRHTEDTVTVGTGEIAAEGNGEQLEGAFLPLEVEAFDALKHLIFVGRCGQDRGRWRDSIGGPERSDSGFSIGVDVYI